MVFAASSPGLFLQFRSGNETVVGRKQSRAGCQVKLVIVLRSLTESVSNLWAMTIVKIVLYLSHMPFAQGRGGTVCVMWGGIQDMYVYFAEASCH